MMIWILLCSTGSTGCCSAASRCFDAAAAGTRKRKEDLCMVRDNWNDNSEVLAAGATCPIPGCGEINFAYHSSSPDEQSVYDGLEFKCSRCGVAFITFDEDLLFHSVRREWLWAGNHSA
jgi:hypothetical protein